MRRLAVMVALLACALAACGGDSTPDRQLGVAEARASRDTAEPAATRITSTVRVTFDGSVEQSSRLPLASAFALLVPDPFQQGKTSRVLARTAKVLPNNPRIVELQVDRL